MKMEEVPKLKNRHIAPEIWFRSALRRDDVEFCPVPHRHSNFQPKTTMSAHLDPNELTTSATADGYPSLTPKVAPAKSTSTSASANPTVTGLRQRVNNLGTQLDQATNHPAVKNAKVAAGQQVEQLRGVLGQSDTVKDLEKRTGVDRILLVIGGGIL